MNEHLIPNNNGRYIYKLTFQPVDDIFNRKINRKINIKDTIEHLQTLDNWIITHSNDTNDTSIDEVAILKSKEAENIIATVILDGRVWLETKTENDNATKQLIELWNKGIDIINCTNLKYDDTIQVHTEMKKENNNKTIIIDKHNDVYEFGKCIYDNFNIKKVPRGALRFYTLIPTPEKLKYVKIDCSEYPQYYIDYNNTTLRYDEKFDELQIFFKFKTSECEGVDHGVYIRKDPLTDCIVGANIEHYSKRNIDELQNLFPFDFKKIIENNEFEYI